MFFCVSFYLSVCVMRSFVLLCVCAVRECVCVQVSQAVKEFFHIFFVPSFLSNNLQVQFDWGVWESERAKGERERREEERKKKKK